MASGHAFVLGSNQTNIPMSRILTVLLLLGTIYSVSAQTPSSGLPTKTTTLAGFSATYDLPTNAEVTIPGAQGSPLKANLRLDRAGKVNRASFVISDSNAVKFTYGIFKLDIHHITYDSIKDHLLCGGKMLMPSEFQEDSNQVFLNFSSLRLNAQGIVDIGNISMSSPIQYHGFYYGLGADQSIYKDSLLLGGYMVLPHNIGQLHTTLRLSANNGIALELDSVKGSVLHAYGYKFDALDATFKQGVWSVNTNLIIPDDFGKLRANGLQIDTSGIVKAPVFDLSNSPEMEMGVYKAKPTQAWLHDNQLRMKAEFYLWNETLYLDTLTILNSGDISCAGVSISSPSATIAGYQMDSLDFKFGYFVIDSLANQKYGFRLDGRANLPNSWGNLKVKNARIYLDGSFDGGHATDKDSLNLNGFKFHLDEGRFFPSIHYYTVSGSIQTHADTSIARVTVDGDVVGYAPVIAGKWSLSGVRFPKLTSGHISVLNIIDTDKDGEYNPATDAIFDISESVLIKVESGALGHFKGASNRPNGTLINVMSGSSKLGTAVIWDGHWEHFAYGLPDLSSGNVQVIADRRSDGYRIAGNGLGGDGLVIVEYRGKDLGKVLVNGNGKFTSPVYQIHNFDPKEIKVFSFKDTDANGLIEINKDNKTDITSSVTINRENKQFYKIFGKSSQSDGSIVDLQLGGSSIGQAMVWDGHWRFDYNSKQQIQPSQISAKIYRGLKLDSLLEDVSSVLKAQVQVLTQEDITPWMEFHSITTDSIGTNNATILLDGKLALPKFGMMPVAGMNISPTGMRMPGKKNSHGNPHFRFDGYNFNLNNFDIDIAKPQAILDGEIILPDNAGRLWAKVDAGQSGASLSSIELEQKEVALGTFTMHVDSLRLNDKEEMVLKGELDILNMDQYLKVDQLTISATTERKEAVINTNGLKLKTNGYALEVSKAHFVVDTLKGGALVDTLELSGVIDLGDLGNLNADKLRFDNNGNITSGKLTVGDKGLKVNGFDFSTVADSIRFVHNEIHIAHIAYPIPGKTNAKLNFRHILIDNQLNFEIDEIKLDASNYDYNGYTLTVDAVSWHEDHLKLGGILSLGGNLGNVEIDDVIMGPDGSISGGAFNLSSATMSYHGFNLAIDSLSMDSQKVIALDGNIVLPDSLGNVKLTGLKLNAQKVLNYGQIGFSHRTMEWLGFLMTVDSLKFAEPYFHFNGSVHIPKLGSVGLADLKLDANGNFSGGKLTLPDSAKVDYNGFSIQVNSIDIESDGLELDGAVTLPSDRGTVSITGLEVDKDGHFTQGHFLYQEGSNPLQFNGLHIQVNSVDFSNGLLEISAALELPKNVGRIGAKLSWQSSTGLVKLDSVEVRNASITYSGFHIDLSNCQYLNNSFVFDGTIDVANVGQFKVDQLSLSAQGDFNGGSVTFLGTEWKWGSLSAKINQASIIDHEILVDADITLPDNMGTLGLKNVDIDMNGKVISASVTLDSLKYAGYTLHLDSASVTNNDLISLAGYLKLPNGHGKIVINKLGISTSGEIQDGDASYSGPGITLAQTTMSIEHIHLSNTSVSLDGKVSFPSSIGGNLDYKGLKFESSGKFDIDSIAANNISIQVHGFTANLSSVSWNKTKQRIDIDGSLGLPGTFGSAGLTGLQIGMDGTLYGGTFDLSGLNMNYHGVSLKPTALSLNQGSITASCNLTLPNNASLSVAGMKIGPSGITDFGQINASGVEFKWNNYDFKLNQLEFSNDVFSFSGQLDFGKYGTLTATDILISTAGDFYGGKFVPSDAQLKFASMDISLDSLVFQQSEFEFSGALTLPGSNGKILFRDIDITTDGKFTGGSLLYQGSGFSFKNGAYRVIPSDITLGDNSITLDARVVETSTDSVKAIMTGTKITGSPFNIQFGTETLLNTEFYYKGFDVKVDTFTVSGTNISYTGSITIPKLGKLNVDGMVMDVSTGKITDHGNITYSGQTWTLGSTSFTIDSVKLEDSFIDIKARMQLPNNAGEVAVHNMRLSTTGSLLGADVDVNNINMGYNGYTIALTHAEIQGSELELDGTINMNTFGTFTVSNLEFDMTSGTFKQATISSQNASFTLGSFTAVPQTISFVNNKIHIDGHLDLPKMFGDNASVSFSGMEIGVNGSFSIGTITSNNVEVKYKGFDLAFTQLAWSEGLILSADLTLPGNSQKILLQNLKVSQSGSVSGGTLKANGVSVAYHGYTLALDDAAFLSGDGIKISGTFTLPGGTTSLTVTNMQFDKSGISDFGSIAMTSSASVKWHDFTVAVSNVGITNGTVMIDGSIALTGVGTLSVTNLGFTSTGNFLPGDIKLTSSQSLTFGQYSATISKIEFSGNVISVDGSIAMSGNRKVSITGMSVDFNGNFNGGSLTYSGDPFNFNGSKVTPYGISFANKTLTASAQMVLPNNLATVTATGVSIDASFNMSVAKVEVSGVSIHYKGIIVNLDSAVYQSSDLSLWGNIQNNKLGNLKVKGLTMNTSGVITGGAVDYSGTQYFGSLKVDITDLGFDWGQGDITISGSLALPSNVGTLVVDTIVLDPHSGALKSGTLSATSPITYGGVGISQISATIDDSKIELSGTATLPDQIGTISVNDLDIGLEHGSISGGTFVYHEEKPITFGGAKITISSLLFNLTEIDLSAQIQLPANLGKAGVNDAKFSNGHFSLQSVSFSGQSVSIKGVSCSITKGLITSSDVKVSVDVSLSADVQFAIDDFDYSYTNGFSGGTFNLTKAAIKYKGFELEILGTDQQTDKAKFSAQFKIPESSGYAKIENIYISLENGVDFSQMTMDYGSLPNLLPTGFNLTVSQFEPINNGILFSGSMTLLGSSLSVKGLKVTTSGIDINQLNMHTPGFKLGSYAMPNLDFEFSKEGSVWEIDISGKADIPDVGGLDFSGYVKSNGDFGGQFVLNGAMIPLGESGFALYNPGGGIYDSSNVFTVKLLGDFAPDGMNHVYVLHGELSVSSSGVIAGSTVGKLFNMIALQRSACSIDLAKGKLAYSTQFSYGIKTPPKTHVIKKVDAVTQKIPTVELMGYGGGLNVSTFTGVDISGSGKCVLVGLQLGTINLDVNNKHFEFYANFHVPNPAGGPDLVSCNGSVDISYDQGAGELSGAASVLGHSLVDMDFTFSPDEMAATAAVNMPLAQFNVDFKATKQNGSFKLDHFHGDAYIGFESMTFADMNIDITATAWSGSAHAWVPGFGSGIGITIQGNANEVTYFDGYEAYRVFNIQLESSQFTYKKVNNRKYISFSSHGSLPHFGRSSFDVELERSGSHWVLTTLHGNVDAYVDVNLPIFGHWHKDLGGATIDYDRNQGKLTVDIHSSLFDVGIVKVTDIYGTVYFHEPSARVGVKGHYGLGKHTYHLWKLHCHYHFCCSGGCHWEKCCYWTVDLGNKYFDIGVTVKGPSLPRPKRPVPVPPAPKIIVESCDADHLHAGQVCKNTQYKNVTFDTRSLAAIQFSNGGFNNAIFKNSILSGTSFDQVAIDKVYFDNSKLDNAVFNNITSGTTLSFANNTSLDNVKIQDSKIQNMVINGLNISGIQINNTTLTKPVLNSLNFEGGTFGALVVSGGIVLQHINFSNVNMHNSYFSGNAFHYAAFNGNTKFQDCEFKNSSFNNCVLDSFAISTSTSFSGSHFSQTVLRGLNLNGNKNLTDLHMENGTAMINVDLSNADISGSNFTGMDFGKVILHQTKASNVHLTGINLAGTQMTNANFSNNTWNNVQAHKSDVSSINFNGSVFVNSDLSLCTIDKNTSFTGATFNGTNLHGVDFSNNLHMDNAIIYGSCDLHGVKFYGTNLSNATFYGVKFHKTDFKEANLSGAKFYNCEFDTVNFQSADLANTSFYNCKFTGFTDFHGATMTGVDLHSIGTSFANTNLTGVDFTNANLSSIDMEGSTIDLANFKNANLTQTNLKNSLSAPLTMMHFDGQSNYLEVEMPTSLDQYQNNTVNKYLTKPSSSGNFDGTFYVEAMLDEPETEVTHELWFKTSNANGGLLAIESYKNGATNGSDRDIFLLNGDIHARLWVEEQIHSSGKNYADGQWHHVAHVFGKSIGGQKLYVDGILVASGTKSKSDFHWQDRLMIGHSFSCHGHEIFNGLIDEVRIWRKALTGDEVKNWMSEPLTFDHPQFKYLIAYYPFDKQTTYGNSVANIAFQGMMSNWQSKSSPESTNNLTSKLFHHGPSLKVDNSLTVETWAISNTSSWNMHGSLIQKRDGYMLSPYTGGTVRFYYTTESAPTKEQFIQTPNIDITKWHHYAVTFGLGKLTFYVDGNEVVSKNVGSTEKLVVQNRPISIGQDQCCSRTPLKGNMSRTNVWSMEMDPSWIKRRASLQQHASLISPFDGDYRYLRLSLKRFDWDKGNYAYNGFGANGMNAVKPKWSTENAPLNIPANMDYNKYLKTLKKRTLEMNVMPGPNNGKEQVLLQHLEHYSTGDEIKALYGFDIRRQADRKVAIHMYRKMYQKTTVNEKYTYPLVDVDYSAVWDYTLDDNVEQNIAFQIIPDGSGEYHYELFVNGESKGQKSINTPGLHEFKYSYFFPTEVYPNRTTQTYSVGAGHVIDVQNPDSDAEFAGLLDRGNFYNGYIYDLRLWDTLVDPSALANWRTKDIDATHPSFNRLIANFPLNDGAQSIEDHGVASQKEVHFGDYIRLKHQETGVQLAMLDKPYTYQGTAGANMLVGIPTTQLENWWRVLPMVGTDLNSVRNTVVKKGDQFVLQNVSTGLYFVSNGDHNAYKSSGDIHELTRIPQSALSTTTFWPTYWKVDSMTVFENDSVIAVDNWQWGARLSMSYSTSGYYLYSDRVRGATKNQVDLFGNQRVGGDKKQSANTIWVIDEVKSEFDQSRVYGKTDKMPEYITLPNFDGAILNNTTMPDGTVKN